MSCVIVGPSGEAKKLGLPDSTEIITPEAFTGATRYMTRVVVIGPRLLNDKDFELINRVPAVLVLTNATDILHVEMHIRAGRLHLTSHDALMLVDMPGPAAFTAPWIDPLLLTSTDLAGFISQDTAQPLHPVPVGFEDLPKAAMTQLATQMRKLSLVQFDPVLGTSPACRSLTGIVCNMANTMMAEVEALPPDLICTEPDAAEAQLAAHPGCRVLICPVIIRADLPVEAINCTITTAAQVSVNLMRVVPGPRLPQGRMLACLIYEIG